MKTQQASKESQESIEDKMLKMLLGMSEEKKSRKLRVCAIDPSVPTSGYSEKVAEMLNQTARRLESSGCEIVDIIISTNVVGYRIWLSGYIKYYIDES